MVEVETVETVERNVKVVMVMVVVGVLVRPQRCLVSLVSLDV
jgi:hypothetical protein